MLTLLHALAVLGPKALFAADSNDGDASGENALADPAEPLSNWRIGGYLGALTHESLVDMLYQPRVPTLHSDCLVDLHGVYTLHRFESVPLELEAESGIDKRFGEDHQSEVDLISVMRWKKFPWNETVYTNFRFGLLGGSYVSSVSPWEKQDSGNEKGSKFLQLLVVELTFAPHADAGYEGFIGLHHRSGIFGLINGVSGGSNYITAGFRFRPH